MTPKDVENKKYEIIDNIAMPAEQIKAAVTSLKAAVWSLSLVPEFSAGRLKTSLDQTAESLEATVIEAVETLEAAAYKAEAIDEYTQRLSHARQNIRAISDREAAENYPASNGRGTHLMDGTAINGSCPVLIFDADKPGVSTPSTMEELFNGSGKGSGAERDDGGTAYGPGIHDGGILQPDGSVSEVLPGIADSESGSE